MQAQKGIRIHDQTPAIEAGETTGLQMALQDDEDEELAEYQQLEAY